MTQVKDKNPVQESMIPEVVKHTKSYDFFRGFIEQRLPRVLMSPNSQVGELAHKRVKALQASHGLYLDKIVGLENWEYFEAPPELITPERLAAIALMNSRYTLQNLGVRVENALQAPSGGSVKIDYVPADAQPFKFRYYHGRSKKSLLDGIMNDSQINTYRELVVKDNVFDPLLEGPVFMPKWDLHWFLGILEKADSHLKLRRSSNYGTSYHPQLDLCNAVSLHGYEVEKQYRDLMEKAKPGGYCFSAFEHVGNDGRRKIHDVKVFYNVIGDLRLLNERFKDVDPTNIVEYYSVGKAMELLIIRALTVLSVSTGSSVSTDFMGCVIETA